MISFFWVLDSNKKHVDPQACIPDFTLFVVICKTYSLFPQNNKNKCFTLFSWRVGRWCSITIPSLPTILYIVPFYPTRSHISSHHHVSSAFLVFLHHRHALVHPGYHHLFAAFCFSLSRGTILFLSLASRQELYLSKIRYTSVQLRLSVSSSPLFIPAVMARVKKAQ